jgi:hypothetical protein
MPSAIPEPLRTVLEGRFNVEIQGRDWIDTIRCYAATTGEDGRLFRRQFAHAILHQSISPEDYYAVTQDPNYPTAAELDERLREVWAWLYNNAPVTED